MLELGRTSNAKKFKEMEGREGRSGDPMPERWVVVVSSSVFLYVQIKLLISCLPVERIHIVLRIFLSGMIEYFVV